MNAYLNYAVEANLGLLLVLALYLVLFHNENDFGRKRLYLLSGMVISLVLPFFHISTDAAQLIPSISNSLPGNWLPEITIWSDPASALPYAMTFWKWVFIGYSAITLILLTRMVWQMNRLVRFIGNSSKVHFGKFQLIQTSAELTAFSFFHIIVLGKGPFSQEEKNLIIRHESIHARQLHSVDMILLHLLIVLFWFNPAVYFLRNILSDIHEFEADAETVHESESPVYSGLLVKAALGKMNFPIANHFNRSTTLKRLIMLNRFHKKIDSWKWFTTAFIGAAFFLVVACQEQVRSNSEGKIDANTDEVFIVVEEVATPSGGMTDYYNFVAANLKYPEQARKMGIEGNVYVEFTVQKDGSVSDLRVIKGIGAGCDKAAMEVIAKSPKWEPGKQRGQAVAMKMVLPIVFKLGSETSATPEPIYDPAEQLFSSMISSKINGKTVIDGKVTDKSGNPMPGVNIVLKYSSKGTVSDANGAFHFETEVAQGDLVLSFVGFRTMEKSFKP